MQFHSIQSWQAFHLYSNSPNYPVKDWNEHDIYCTMFYINVVAHSENIEGTVVLLNSSLSGFCWDGIIWSWRNELFWTVVSHSATKDGFHANINSHQSYADHLSQHGGTYPGKWLQWAALLFLGSLECNHPPFSPSFGGHGSNLQTKLSHPTNFMKSFNLRPHLLRIEF